MIPNINHNFIYNTMNLKVTKHLCSLYKKFATSARHAVSTDNKTFTLKGLKVVIIYFSLSHI